MELKPTAAALDGDTQKLLIVPYGIETAYPHPSPMRQACF